MCIVSIVFIVSMVVGYKDKYGVCKLSYRIMASFYMFSVSVIFYPTECVPALSVAGIAVEYIRSVP